MINGKSSKDRQGVGVVILLVLRVLLDDIVRLHSPYSRILNALVASWLCSSARAIFTFSSHRFHLPKATYLTFSRNTFYFQDSLVSHLYVSLILLSSESPQLPILRHPPVRQHVSARSDATKPASQPARQSSTESSNDSNSCTIAIFIAVTLTIIFQRIFPIPIVGPFPLDISSVSKYARRERKGV